MRRFLIRTFAQALWHDLLLNRPLLRRLRSAPMPRWIEVTRRYRRLAIEMGGVLIKIGQFLSTRVDLLPPEITHELAGLQDEVPPEDLADIEATIAAEFDRPREAVFPEFAEAPLGAASLAQVHAARLADGQSVVVKVLRPRIETLVETDLAALALATRWLKVSRRVRRRVDLDRLCDEIARTTRAELDLLAEGRSTERFGEAFADDSSIAVPAIHWPASTRRVLVLERIDGLKIDDRQGLLDAGIDPAAVARRLYRCYMEQIFDHHFVHADPHPGNLFVRPRGEGEFEIVFLDFGMTSTVPERLRQALREYIIALATQDARRMVQSYRQVGVLLPGADLERLERLHEELFERLWGIKAGSLRDTAFEEAGYFFEHYRDLLFEMPFQIQVDLIFVSRGVSLLAGVVTGLDPDIDPWAETIPFAERLATRELLHGLRGLVTSLPRQLRRVAEVPPRLDRLLRKIESASDRTPPKGLSPATVSWSLVAAALIISAQIARVHQDGSWPWLLAAAVIAFLAARRGR
ncbi:MAG: AarF/UbiB family protein [Acidobacteriota bacterium]